MPTGQPLTVCPHCGTGFFVAAPVIGRTPSVYVCPGCDKPIRVAIPQAAGAPLPGGEKAPTPVQAPGDTRQLGLDVGRGLVQARVELATKILIAFAVMFGLVLSAAVAFHVAILVVHFFVHPLKP